MEYLFNIKNKRKNSYCKEEEFNKIDGRNFKDNVIEIEKLEE